MNSREPCSSNRSGSHGDSYMPFIPIRSFVLPLVAVAAVFGPPVVADAAAQTSSSAQAVPSHRHYDDSAPAPAPAPGAPLAPRLQNLGTHVFPVSTTVER